MTWYSEWFGADYVDVYRHRDIREAEDFIVTLKRVINPEPGSAILDLCCGAGRYSVLLARQGYNVTGLDLSDHLIGYALNAAAKENVSIEFIVRDMRDIRYTDNFDIVVNMFTSFGYFKEDIENLKVFRSVAKSLKQEGFFIHDFMNKEYVLSNLKARDSFEIDGMVVEQSRLYREDTGRIEKNITLLSNGDKREYKESVMLYSMKDIQSMFTETGIRPVHVFGDYHGKPFDSDSPRLITIGKKE